MSSLLLKFPAHLSGLLLWWIYQMPIRIFHYFESLLGYLEGNLQFVGNLKLWLMFEPLFGDYGWRGRLVGFLLRGLRMVVTLVLYIGVFALGIFSLLGWLTLPFLAVALILGLI